MRSPRSLLVAFALISLASAAQALEVREGRMKLVLQENTGRFSLYYLSDMKKERYEALFVDQDPRTSFVALQVDDRSLRLGDTTSLRFRAEKTENGGRFVFESPSISVTQTFTFIKTANAALADGVRMDITAVNRGERESTIGFRFLLDTNLGEKAREHFITDRRSIVGETVMKPETEGDRWWYSKNDCAGLMGSLLVPGINAPDSVHIANWKRLNDAPWKVVASAGRNFNLLPYSIDDSAICYYFEPKPVARGAERSVSILLAAASDAGFAATSTAVDDGLSRLLSASVEQAESPELALRTDLVTVRDLIERVDAAIASGGAVSDEELAALETVMERLKERHGTK
jgi:hypothetical protein